MLGPANNTAANGSAIAARMPHTLRMEAKAWVLNLNHLMIHWRLWKASTWYYETGIPAGLALLGALLLFDRVRIPAKLRSVTPHAWLAIPYPVI